jgi:hypothetical protein
MQLQSGVVVVVLCLALVCGGCSTSRSSGFLQDYEQLSEGQSLELFWADGTLIHQSRYEGIVLGAVESRVEDEEGISGQDACDWLKRAVQGNAPQGDLVLGRSGKVARLELAVTEMTLGSAFARMMAGELGAGHVWVQVEGRVVDAGSGVLLASFADRRRDSGSAGLEDLAGSAGSGLLREMIVAIGDDIRAELARAFGL